MHLPRDSNGGDASYRAPLAEPLLDRPRRQDWLGLLRGGPPTRSTGGVAVDWASVRSTCREWVRHPMNAALLLWLLCVGASGGMLALLLLGLLDGAFPAPADRSHWAEVNNQVLNALFTLMSLYQHPALLHHLFLLCRWRLPADAAELRAAYCSGGGQGQARAGERVHVAVVVALLHITVGCQYALCWLYWCFTGSTRPELAEDGFTALGVAAPVLAVVYTVCSPLGSDPSGDLDAPSVTEQSPKTLAHADTLVVVVEPEWTGGMFDCDGGDAAAGCCLSLSCTFCIFGWNAERLGFGNACVHAATFALLCFAPLWVLGVTALRVHDAAVGDVVGGAGVLLCAGGLLYGGYWRVQMRRKFGLPGSAACCGSKSATDYATWLFCWPCALAQEVRTASLYHIHGETFFHRIPAAAVGDHEPLPPPRHRADQAIAPETSVSAASDEHLVVVLLHDEMVPPPVVRVVVVADDDTCLECNVVHVQEKIEPPFPTSAVDVEEEGGSSLLASNQEEPVYQKRSSGGRWRVEKLKRMINVVTMVSLLFLLYTRGFIP
ncbi:hypothetical protein QYE76_003611 [Lolium multiflorum]|uniref:Uncharacterized protein n=1 Tax=Lolium multiflorum TaxID=4521 RepID=A0AAD8W1R6_LOLMU|nr:hypothetical protein QYE76_003611 [Lolium multiflorum]